MKEVVAGIDIGGTNTVFGLVDDYTRQLSGAAQAKFFGGNAVKFYGLK